MTVSFGPRAGRAPAAQETFEAFNDEAARAIADKHARSFRCGEDKPNEFRD
jgi:hypothetical protein